MPPDGVKSIPTLRPALRRLALGCALPALLLSGCSIEGVAPRSSMGLASASVPDSGGAAGAGAGFGGLNSQIGHYAAVYHVPESLVRRIIVRESGYNPRARHGPYWGLMQIRYDTAQSMGYGGSPAGLLDADTNLRFAVKYLAGAYKVAYGDPEKAVSFYATGYYYDARRLGMLEDVGFKRGK